MLPNLGNHQIWKPFRQNMIHDDPCGDVHFGCWTGDLDAILSMLCFSSRSLFQMVLQVPNVLLIINSCNPRRFHLIFPSIAYLFPPEISIFSPSWNHVFTWVNSLIVVGYIHILRILAGQNWFFVPARKGIGEMAVSGSFQPHLMTGGGFIPYHCPIGTSRDSLIYYYWTISSHITLLGY